jgi:hypothetical protein
MVFTRSCHWSPSWVIWILLFLRFNLILSSNVRLDRPISLFHCSFPNNIVYTPVISPVYATSHAHLIFHHLITLIILWHVCWKPELWSQRRQPLLEDGSLKIYIARQEPACHVTAGHRCNRRNAQKWRNCWRRRSLCGPSRDFIRGQLKEVPAEASGQSMRLAWDGRKPARTWARKPLPSNVTETTSLYVIVICKCSHELWKCPMNPVITQLRRLFTWGLR